MKHVATIILEDIVTTFQGIDTDGTEYGGTITEHDPWLKTPPPEPPAP